MLQTNSEVIFYNTKYRDSDFIHNFHASAMQTDVNDVDSDFIAQHLRRFLKRQLSKLFEIVKLR